MMLHIRNKTGRNAGFTLMEMLVAIAITVLLLGLILAPIIQTFAMTSQTNAMVQAQDTARGTLEQVSREIGQAMFIFDNSASPINFPVEQRNGTVKVVPALYGMIDIQLPKMVMHCNNPNHPAGQPRDYDRGDDAWPLCPVCLVDKIPITDDDVEARPKHPLVADDKIVRYFIGLRDNDPSSTTLPNPPSHDWQESGSPDNGFILYRAEYTPNDPNLFAPDPADKTGNTLLTNDPNFFYSKASGKNGQQLWKNWKAIAIPVVPQIEMDLVKIEYDNSGMVTSLMPSVRFQLTRMTNDSFNPAEITDLSSESPTSIPTLYRCSYGGWGTSIGVDNPDPYNVSVSGYNDADGMNDIWYKTSWDSNNHLVIDEYTRPNKTSPYGSPVQVFDITAYEAGISSTPAGQFPQFPSPDPNIAFIVDPIRGEVRFDFPDGDSIGNLEIKAMNADIVTNVDSTTNPPGRAHRMSKFGGTPPANRRIVPGSEIVTGPDMTPGIPLGEAKRVRYERVPWNLGDPGRNQYKINYGMADTTGNDVGWIIFSPAYDEIIPEKMYDILNGTYATNVDSTIDITYKFQLNRDGDVVVGSYSTKTLLTITMGIRYFDRSSGKVQPVELTNKVRVRNLLR